MKIICKNCGWSWNRNKGGVNPFKCHKCGYNNKDMYSKKIVGLGATKKKPVKNDRFTRALEYAVKNKFITMSQAFEIIRNVRR